MRTPCACTEVALHQWEHMGFCSNRKQRKSPGFGWNIEAIDNFDQLKAKMRNNYQSNVTAAIPYTVICMWGW